MKYFKLIHVDSGTLTKKERVHLQKRKGVAVASSKVDYLNKMT